MDNDDIQVGRILTRREVLALFGAIAGAAILDACAPGQATQPTSAPAQVPTTAPTRAAGATTATPTTAATQAATQAPTTAAAVATPSCVVKPALTEGPYFVD